jgi:hypothetical protein
MYQQHPLMVTTYHLSDKPTMQNSVEFILDTLSQLGWQYHYETRVYEEEYDYTGSRYILFEHNNAQIVLMGISKEDFFDNLFNSDLKNTLEANKNISAISDNINDYIKEQLIT